MKFHFLAPDSGFPGISRITHEGNGLKFGMHIYREHFQNWLVYEHVYFYFLILPLFWIIETDQILGLRAFPGKHMAIIAWNF